MEDQTETYTRRKEDALMIDVATLKAHLSALVDTVEGINRLVTILLEQQQQAKEERAIELALERKQRDILAKIGAFTVWILGILLGAWLSYAIPTYMGKH